ncbi:DUF6777 domain-containing protein [Mycolicibacterium austroafricanum]|uniref:DUF6777 domain-containing protein n=1 Tax=Mycolicibacterium austroafricanum TaxID=39687 RepID=A0ABT8HKI7_MYCAO|nr:DUF6777 domain-containing protein [Mycolicibacterium austroafricanum]MDN4521277.1 hypothetical protein [Mycolicibacterium austroafricanum]QRZ08164.1 hypothetical protein JN090_06415 [Mycolicibacterium austroafricanum]
MTDVPVGWQDPNSQEPSTKRNPTAVLTAAAVLLTVAVLATFVAVVLIADDGAGEDAHGSPIMLIAANAQTENPFTPSTALIPPQDSSALTPHPASPIPVSAQRGVQVADGLQPGLYGGSAQTNSCDAAALANYLDRDPTLATVWGNTVGVEPPALPHYLNTLTPVVLTYDTWVTSHTPVDGAGTPFQAVLQAGSAVLVDGVGVPRAHCASGAPLRPPLNASLAEFVTAGERWPGFEAQNVIAVAYADPTSPEQPVEEFTLQDLSSGQPFTRAAGGTINIDPQSSVPLPDPASMNAPPT